MLADMPFIFDDTDDTKISVFDMMRRRHERLADKTADTIYYIAHIGRRRQRNAWACLCNKASLPSYKCIRISAVCF